MEPVAFQSSTMVGRDAELTEIASSLGVRPSRPAHELSDVLLSGDAGVGKTRLLKALRGLAVDDGWQVVAGHCLDFGDSALPYLPYHAPARGGPKTPENIRGWRNGRIHGERALALCTTCGDPARPPSRLVVAPVEF